LLEAIYFALLISNIMSENKNNRSSLLLLLLLLIGSVGFNVYQFNNHKTTVVQHSNEVDSLITVRIDVERELASTEMELEKYRGIAGNLDTLLNEANGKIAEKENKIRSLIAKEKNSAKLSKKLKAELAELKELRDEFLDKIDVLMAENKKLKEDNAQLNTALGDVTQQKNMLEQKVTTASQLKAEYVKVASFKKKNSGKFVESVLAKKTNKMEACFTVMDNKVSGTGDKMVYLRIMAPNGKPLMGNTRAELKTADGETVDATASQKINYTGEKQNICLNYENDERILEGGTYTIEVFIENTLVHSSSYVLR
jgi:predicted  nucleic acid-binding Zn-ribbon protein